jgi:branched-chain amino acid aminotransferase
MHASLLHNGEIRRTSDLLISPGQTGFMNGWGVFSTLRVYDGVLFAFARHYARMKRDAQLMHVPLVISAEELQRQLLKLVQANNAVNATLRVSVVRNRGGLYEGSGIRSDADLVAFTADMAKWGDGVRLYYVPNARHAASPFAGTKVTSWSHNLTWYEEAHERGFDEVILLNEHGQVSECTSANLFALFGDQVITPPLSTSGCLPGITRALLLEEIKVPGLSIRERDLTPQELETADQVFISSSTRNLLPVLEIEGRSQRQSPQVLGLLQRAFSEYQAAYAARHLASRETVNT